MDNIRELLSSIQEASGGQGNVALLPVTKNQPPERINELVEAGIISIGENRVKEWLVKKEKLHPQLRLHMIGQLQSNKVRAIIGDVELIHSVDRPSLAREIQKQAAAIERTVDVLIQVNIAGEEQKAGVAPKELDGLVSLVGQMPNLRLRGLMTIAPLVEDPEEARPVFRQARQLFESMRGLPHFDTLSMGMSGDYRVAVQEGATIVRIGSAVFAGD